MLVLLDVLEPHHGGDVVVHRRGVSPYVLSRSGVVLVPLLLLFQESPVLCLPFLYGEEGVVDAVEEGAGLLVVVPRENIGGVGVTSCIKLGLGPRP